MFNKLRNTLHEKVHGARIGRHKRHVKPASTGGDECETSSASSVEPDQLDPDRFKISTTFAIEVVVRSVVDLSASPAYFYVCVGEEDEPTALKKKRGIQSSGILYGKSPQLNNCTFLLPINGLMSPELTIRFSRSLLVGTDTFLGECNLKINLKGSLDSLGDEVVLRIAGGGLAVACLSWKLLPFDAKSPLEKRSNILPEVQYTSDNDKLDGLVESIRKTICSLHEDHDAATGVSADSPLRYKLDFLTSIFNSISATELDYVLSRISVSELVKYVPSLFELPNASFMINLKSSEISPLNLSRVIRALEPTTSEVVSKLIISCIDTGRLDQVKYLLNRGTDKYDLVYLMNCVIESKFLRDQLFIHFDNFSTKNVGIVSEIDQVVYSPFGSVRMWPDGPIPGFKLLFESLTQDVTFVSNRPISSLVDTRKIVREIGMTDAPLLLSSGILVGPTPSNQGGLVQRLQQSYSASVVEAWNQYKQVFPKRSVIWFGENIEMAKVMMRIQPSDGAKIVLAIVMGDEMVGKGGPVLVDDDSGRIVACANYVQASMACLDYGYLTLETIDRLNLLFNFQKMIEKLIKSLDSNKIRHKYLIKERITDMRFDLQRLSAKVQALLRKSKYASQNGGSPVLTADDIVDSVILTPIEALSPSLTNHSPSPGPPGIAAGSYDSEIILTGV